MGLLDRILSLFGGGDDGRRGTDRGDRDDRGAGSRTAKSLGGDESTTASTAGSTTDDSGADDAAAEGGDDTVGGDVADDTVGGEDADDAEGGDDGDHAVDADEAEGDEVADHADGDDEDDPVAASATGTPGAGVDVQEIEGVGPAYAERLSAAGVEDVAALAGADPETLAMEVDVAEGRVARWVEQAVAWEA